MKLAIYGAAGMIGGRITAEALRRGHSVSALVRTTGKLALDDPKLAERKADIADAGQVAQMVRGHDAVICAISPRNERGPQLMALAILSLAQGLPQAGVKRLLVVGGAGSLEVAPGKRLMDTPHFPEAYKVEAKAGAEALALLRLQDQLDWTFISPPGVIQPGERLGVFRIGGEQLLTDATGQSRISAEDYAVAMIDEVEQGRNIKRRITVAY
ncbi:MAG TPA: NAD(P)-dependent oxidoreductase [bacterium]|jgi:putative NADH-flavin reductase|nr:NAD(P)-dependent oxidoreductase [bacterium]